jgi:hypothetical protein
MHLMVIWTIKPENSKAAIQRFTETGAPPPEGVSMLSRWHDVSGGRGFSIAEADDAAAVSKWCHQWSDLLSFEIIPVLDDQQLAGVLAG